MRLNRLCAAAFARGATFVIALPTRSVAPRKRSRNAMPSSCARAIFARSIRRGKSTANSCGSAAQSCAESAMGNFIFHSRRAGGGMRRPLRPLRSLLGLHLLQPLRETASMRLLRLGERLEPLGDLAEAFVAGRSREPWVHLRVLVRLAGDCRGKVLLRVADRLACSGISHLPEVLQIAVAGSGPP